MSSQSPSVAERRVEAAEGYLLLDMPEHALKELAAVAGDAQRDPEIEFEVARLRGEAYRQQEEFETGLGHFEQADGQRPGDLSVMIGMAWCLKRTDRLTRAIDVMQAAYEFHPEEPIVLYNLACYYALADDKTNALSWLGRAIRMEGGLRNLIAEETDFDSLRHDDDFQLVIGTGDQDVPET